MSRYDLLKNLQNAIASGKSNEAFIYACETGQISHVEELLRNPKCDVTMDDNQAFKLACQNGHIDIVKLLLGEPRIDPTSENNYSLKFAAQEGRKFIVELLMNDKRIPQQAKDAAARLARKGGHDECVVLLDPHGKTKPDPTKKTSAEGQQARSQAAQGWGKGNSVFDKVANSS